jgi:hypothetical protein
MSICRQESLPIPMPVWDAWILDESSLTNDELQIIRGNQAEVRTLPDDIGTSFNRLVQRLGVETFDEVQNLSNEAVETVLSSGAVGTMVRNHALSVLRVRLVFPEEFAYLNQHFFAPSLTSTDTGCVAVCNATLAVFFYKLIPVNLYLEEKVVGVGSNGKDIKKMFVVNEDLVKEIIPRLTRWVEGPKVANINRSMFFAALRKFVTSYTRVLTHLAGNPTNWRNLSDSDKDVAATVGVDVVEGPKGGKKGKGQRKTGSRKGKERATDGDGDEGEGEPVKIVLTLPGMRGQTLDQQCQNAISFIEGRQRQQQSTISAVQRSSGPASRRSSTRATVELPTVEELPEEETADTVPVASEEQDVVMQPVEPVHSEVEVQTLGQPTVAQHGVILNNSVFECGLQSANLLAGYAYSPNLAKDAQPSVLLIADLPYFVLKVDWDSLRFAHSTSRSIEDFTNAALINILETMAFTNGFAFIFCSDDEKFYMMRDLRRLTASELTAYGIKQFDWGCVTRKGTFFCFVSLH